MALIVTENQGPLSIAIGRRLDALGSSWDRIPPEDEDLFERALEHDALVYLAAPRMLDAALHPHPNAERLRYVLGAAYAASVKVVVFVAPPGGAYAAERDVLERKGLPYVVVVSPPLLDEIGEELHIDHGRTLWVPRGGTQAVTTAAKASRAIVAALDTEEQGGEAAVEARELDAETLFRRAAALAGQVRVRGVRPGVFRLVRPLARWVKRGEPRALSLCDRLYGDVTRAVGPGTVGEAQALPQAA